jgi:hypothetical protein
MNILTLMVVLMRPTPAIGIHQQTITNLNTL